MPKHTQFMAAIQEKKKVTARYYSHADSGVLDRMCASMSCVVVDGRGMPDAKARESAANPFGGRNSILLVASSPAAAHLADAAVLPVKNENKQTTKKV